MAQKGHMTTKGVAEFYREMARENIVAKTSLEEKTAQAVEGREAAPAAPVTRTAPEKDAR